MARPAHRIGKAMNTVFHAVELASGRQVAVRVEQRKIAGEAQTYYTLHGDGRSYTAGEFWRLFREIDEENDGHGIPAPF